MPYQVKVIEAGGPPPLVTYAYDLNGNRLTKTLENGATATYTYDMASRLTQIAHKKGAANLVNVGYTLNAVGNRVNKLSAVGSQPSATESYSYDSIDQVTAAAYGSNRTESFAYDPVGNRLTSANSQEPTAKSYTTNPLNQYTQVGSQMMTYDAKGNLQAAGTAGIMPTFNFDYDSKNRLLSATVGNATMTVAYDYQNRPVSRTINSTSTYFIYDGWNLIAEYSSAGTLQTKYIHGPVIDEILAKIDSTGTVYYHHDGLGSTIALTNDQGQVTETYQYDGCANIFQPLFSICSAMCFCNPAACLTCFRITAAGFAACRLSCFTCTNP